MRTMLRNSWKLMLSGCCVFTAKTIETYLSAARATSVICGHFSYLAKERARRHTHGSDQVVEGTARNGAFVDEIKHAEEVE